MMRAHGQRRAAATVKAPEPAPGSMTLCGDVPSWSPASASMCSTTGSGVKTVPSRRRLAGEMLASYSTARGSPLLPSASRTASARSSGGIGASNAHLRTASGHCAACCFPMEAATPPSAPSIFCSLSLAPGTSAGSAVTVSAQLRKLRARSHILSNRDGPSTNIALLLPRVVESVNKSVSPRPRSHEPSLLRRRSQRRLRLREPVQTSILPFLKPMPETSANGYFTRTASSRAYSGPNSSSYR
jgi:hypothetical protein